MRLENGQALWNEIANVLEGHGVQWADVEDSVQEIIYTYLYLSNTDSLSDLTPSEKRWLAIDALQIAEEQVDLQNRFQPYRAGDLALVGLDPDWLDPLEDNDFP